MPESNNPFARIKGAFNRGNAQGEETRTTDQDLVTLHNKQHYWVRLGKGEATGHSPDVQLEANGSTPTTPMPSATFQMLVRFSELVTLSERPAATSASEVPVTFDSALGAIGVATGGTNGKLFCLSGFSDVVFVEKKPALFADFGTPSASVAPEQPSAGPMYAPPPRGSEAPPPLASNVEGPLQVGQKRAPPPLAHNMDGPLQVGQKRVPPPKPHDFVGPLKPGQERLPFVEPPLLT